MVEFLLAHFQDLPMSFYTSGGPWYLVVSPLAENQRTSPPPARWLINAPAPIAENGRRGCRLQFN